MTGLLLHHPDHSSGMVGCVCVCVGEGGTQTEIKRQSSRAMRAALCGLSEHEPRHAHWPGPAQGMEVPLVELLRSLEVNTRQHRRCYELKCLEMAYLLS